MGAVAKDEWEIYKMSGSALEKLAKNYLHYKS
jgi:hypothetical protein